MSYWYKELGVATDREAAKKALTVCVLCVVHMCVVRTQARCALQRQST